MGWEEEERGRFKRLLTGSLVKSDSLDAKDLGCRPIGEKKRLMAWSWLLLGLGHNRCYGQWEFVTVPPAPVRY